MTLLKESVAKAVNARTLLADSAPSETMVGSLAMSDALGAVLWRLKYGRDASVRPRAMALIAMHWRKQPLLGARFSKAGGTDQIMTKLINQALYEWVHDVCTKCRGRGAVGGLWYGDADKQPARLCPKCKGCGRRRFELRERAAALGLPHEPVRRHWEPVLVLVLAWLDEADVQCQRDVRRQVSAHVP